MIEFADTLASIGPQITLLIGACLCIGLGLSASKRTRRYSGPAAILSLLIAAVIAISSDRTAPLAMYVQIIVAVMGLLLLLAAMAPAPGPGSAADSDRGEFFGFFLISLAGAMLCGGAGDLVWLFLALELTSLPTYVMIAMSRRRLDAKEAAVKYFFLGAMSVAVFLYGFTLIYGATGTTNLAEIAVYVQDVGVTPLMTLGLLLAILGIAFKIAAAPMHFYVADVYQGAATPVTAFLAIVPKIAGFVAIILLLRLVGWPLPDALMWLLWIMAAATMTIGNVLGLLQTSVKRMLAYSAVAHSGYMIIGLIGNHVASDGAASERFGLGVAAILFYLPAYGLATLGVFAVLASIERRGEEADSFDDLAGLSKRSPFLATVMLVCVLSLLGMPPMIGLLGKVYLLTTAINTDLKGLVIIAVLNTAISAVYYLRIVAACFFSAPDPMAKVVEAPRRRIAAGLAAVLSLFLFFDPAHLIQAAKTAADDAISPPPQQQLPDQPPQPHRRRGLDVADAQRDTSESGPKHEPSPTRTTGSS
jgi:NADH-quinone oxidoreductase subunit N